MTSRATATKTQPTPREEEILAAAARIFREKGYHGASVRDIAESVGLLKGSLYHYIRSKEELLARLFEGALEDTIQELEKIAARDAAPPVRLREMVKAYVGAVTENLDAVSLYLREWRALRPQRVTGWTLEPNQGGWMDAAFVKAVAQAFVTLYPQAYYGDQAPTDVDMTRCDLIERGFTRGAVSAFYSALSLPPHWDGIVFRFDQLP